MISIVVCTFNRAPVLRRMLQRFFEQERLEEFDYELLIVDNNSRDDTSVVARRFLRSERVRYFLETQQGLSFARNRGVVESRGEFISFLDDDVLVHENWLRNLKACFAQTNADVVGGRVSLTFEASPEIWMGDLFRKCLSEVDFGASQKILDNGDGLYGANLSFRKQALISAGLFNTNIGRSAQGLVSGEETDIVRKILSKKGKVLYDPDVFVEHLIGSERLQWRYFVKRAHGDGLTLEFLEPEASPIFQLLRVGNALLEFLKAAYSRYTINFRANTPYSQKLAEFNFLRRSSYLNARFCRLTGKLNPYRTK